MLSVCAEPRLVVFEPRDSETLRRYCVVNRAHLAPWEPSRDVSYHDAASMRALVAARHRQYLDRTALHLCALDTRGEMLAECNFTNIVKGPFQACNLGYSVAAAREGHGIMTATVKKGIEIMFNEYGLHRIMANYMPRNARSARVLERCGFVREGYAKAYLKIAGRWEDHVLASVVNPNGVDPPE